MLFLGVFVVTPSGCGGAGPWQQLLRCPRHPPECFFSPFGVPALAVLFCFVFCKWMLAGKGKNGKENPGWFPVLVRIGRRRHGVGAGGPPSLRSWGGPWLCVPPTGHHFAEIPLSLWGLDLPCKGKPRIPDINLPGGPRGEASPPSPCYRGRDGNRDGHFLVRRFAPLGKGQRGSGSFSSSKKASPGAASHCTGFFWKASACSCASSAPAWHIWFGEPAGCVSLRCR